MDDASEDGKDRRAPVSPGVLAALRRLSEKTRVKWAGAGSEYFPRGGNQRGPPELTTGALLLDSHVGDGGRSRQALRIIYL